MKIIRKDNNKYLKWIITNKCNYNCSYCFEKNFKGIELSNENLFLTADKINEFMKINNLNTLVLLGGELFLLDTNIILKLLERHFLCISLIMKQRKSPLTTTKHRLRG